MAPNKGPMQTMIRGPYRQKAPTDKGPLQTRDPYRRCAISTDKAPLQEKDPYMIYMQGLEGLLQTKCPYMIYRQRALYRYTGSL